ncbi:hypothetical protein ACFX2A_000329 [Malus domestica]
MHPLYSSLPPLSGVAHLFPCEENQATNAIYGTQQGSSTYTSFPFIYSLELAGRRPAYPTFQQPMRPVTSLFLPITGLVRSKSPKNMSYAVYLALHPKATIRDPSSTSCPWL